MVSPNSFSLVNSPEGSMIRIFPANSSIPPGSVTLRALSTSFILHGWSPYDASRSWEYSRTTVSRCTPHRVTLETRGTAFRVRAISSVYASKSRRLYLLPADAVSLAERGMRVADDHRFPDVRAEFRHMQSLVHKCPQCLRESRIIQGRGRVEHGQSGAVEQEDVLHNAFRFPKLGEQFEFSFNPPPIGQVGKNHREADPLTFYAWARPECGVPESPFPVLVHAGRFLPHRPLANRP